MAEFSTASWYRHVRAQELRARRKPQRRSLQRGEQQHARQRRELKMEALKSALKLQQCLQSEASAYKAESMADETPHTEEATTDITDTIRPH